jgi:hypothetical protein
MIRSRFHSSFFFFSLDCEVSNQIGWRNFLFSLSLAPFFFLTLVSSLLFSSNSPISNRFCRNQFKRFEFSFSFAISVRSTSSSPRSFASFSSQVDQQPFPPREIAQPEHAPRVPQAEVSLSMCVCVLDTRPLPQQAQGPPRLPQLVLDERQQLSQSDVQHQVHLFSTMLWNVSMLRSFKLSQMREIL